MWVPFAHNFRMLVSEIIDYARQFTKSKGAEIRGDIVRKVWVEDKKEGLELLSKSLGVSYEYLYGIGRIDEHKKNRNRSRRKRKEKSNINLLDIKDIAMEAAGGGALMHTGGKKTGHYMSKGGVKSSASGQAWQAITGS